VIRFADVPQRVLGPLADRPDADWYRAPAGKWCPAQIVQHLALGIDYSARTLDSRRDRPPMQRRRRSLGELAAYSVIIGLGWIPSGRRAPQATTPVERPAREEVERLFRQGVERMLALERELLPARGSDLFAKHPIMGDLTLPEWLRFHASHCEHHARQILSRLGE
jgi:DinB superfamily